MAFMMYLDVEEKKGVFLLGGFRIYFVGSITS